jgi:hypothetical protein
MKRFEITELPPYLILYIKVCVEWSILKHTDKELNTGTYSAHLSQRQRSLDHMKQFECSIILACMSLSRQSRRTCLHISYTFCKDRVTFQTHLQMVLVTFWLSVSCVWNYFLLKFVHVSGC